MIPSSSLVTSKILKRLLRPVFSTLRLSRVSRATVKRLVSNKLCAQLKRELIRVNITIETDEDDLIGGFRLVNGETVWHNGPVIEALEREAVLLLDEVDLKHLTRFCVSSPSWKVRVSSSRRLVSSSNLRKDSTYSPTSTPRVRVPMMDDSLVLTF